MPEDKILKYSVHQLLGSEEFDSSKIVIAVHLSHGQFEVVCKISIQQQKSPSLPFFWEEAAHQSNKYMCSTKGKEDMNLWPETQVSHMK